MNLNDSELIEFFDAIYDEECEADDIKKGIREDLKGYASKIEADPKAVSSAYALYKKYKSGKSTAEECDDYSQLATLVEGHFSQQPKGSV